MKAPSLLALALVIASPVEALEITHVDHAPASFAPERGEEATVRFRLSEAAEVVVHLYDERDEEVASIRAGLLAPGDHAVVWQGRDAAGNAMPPGAYRYTITGVSAEGQRVVHDPGAAARDDVAVRDLRWEPASGSARYWLQLPSRVRLRLYARKGGPLLATLVDDASRPAGANAERWTPSEAQARLLSDEAFPWARASALAANEIVVVSDGAVRALHSNDFDIRVEIGREDAHGIPVRVTAEPPEANRLYAERFGVELYVDGALAFKNELGYLPLTWHWSLAGVEPGPHVITTNVFGYAGNLGSESVMVEVGQGSQP